MAKTRDGIQAEMLMYLMAAKEAIDTLRLRDPGDGTLKREIVNLACSFRQSDVIEEADMTITVHG